MMPQLMPQHKSFVDFFDWAMSTLLLAVTLFLEGGNPIAQLRACLLPWCMLEGIQVGLARTIHL
jgi:hypothetical protein